MIVCSSILSYDFALSIQFCGKHCIIFLHGRDVRKGYLLCIFYYFQHFWPPSFVKKRRITRCMKGGARAYPCGHSRKTFFTTSHADIDRSGEDICLGSFTYEGG